MTASGVEPGPEVPERESELNQQRQDPRRLWRLFVALAGPFWRHASGAKLHLVWVLLLSMAKSGLVIVFSFVQRDFWTALQKKDERTFWRSIIIFTCVLVCALPLFVWYAYARDCLALKWRKWHTQRILGDYYARRNYYEVDQRTGIDNPDQRIADDIDSFTSGSLGLFFSVLSSVLDLFNFSFILMRMYARLFIVLFSYASVGTVLAMLIGRRLITLNFAQLRYEADFRFSLVRVRENAESIAFYQGEEEEKAENLRRLDFVARNLMQLLVWTRHLSMFTTFYQHVISILPLCVIAPMYFAGTLELGDVSQSQQAFYHVLDDLSIIVNQFDSLSRLSAGVDRLGEFEEFLYGRFIRSAVEKECGTDASEDEQEECDIESDAQTTTPTSSEMEFAERDSFEGAQYGRARSMRDYADCREGGHDSERERLHRADEATRIATRVVRGSSDVWARHLTLQTPGPQGRVLFEGMSFHVAAGQRLLITGPSGCGKSSVLRAFAGLWTVGSGEVGRPPLAQVAFLPQRAYCPAGTLRAQVAYPARADEHNDKELEELLETVGLGDLPFRIGGMHVVRDWTATLSLGELQRVAFARLLYAKPRVAFLDECTSALDPVLEQRLYQRLVDSGIAFVSVAHRPALRVFHNALLELRADGSVAPVARIAQGGKHDNNEGD